MKTWLFVFYLLGCFGTSCSQATPSDKQTLPMETKGAQNDTLPVQLDTATLGGGCFWCVEAIYQDLIGVYKVKSGYSGGSVKNPSYRAVCTGLTGHAEVIQVVFDPAQISFKEILEVFFTVHNPTTINQQGNDIGTQYRSVIFYHSDTQQSIAETVKKEAQAIWDDPIVTELAPFTEFYPAEDYHQNYYKENPNQPYCNFVITPKVKKFREKYKDKLKQ